MKKNQPRNNPMTCNHYQQTALIEPRGTYWFSWKRSRESWKSLQSFLPTWTSCPSIWGFKIPPHIPPGRCDTKYSLMPPLKGPLHIWGPPYFQHPTAMIIFWELKFDWSLSCSPELSQICRPAERKRGSQPWPLTFHPHVPDFPQRTLWGSWFLLVIFPGSGHRGRPHPSNKHIAHLSAKSINIIM